MTDDTPLDRRTLLGAVAGVATLSGCAVFGSGGGSDSGPLGPGDDSATTPVPRDRARDLAEQFAPTVYFDAAEKWFPTDPRPYERDREGGTVVDGFAAFDGYTREYGDEPPAPTVFFNAVSYDSSPLAVVQYWFYSAFDQFTTNFHWHDWEALHVFVDTGTGEPQLYVASSHSRSVPNNEFLDPDRKPRVLSELGSHSSALSVNDDVDRFQRFSVGDLAADITNSALEGIEDVAELPLAYGLPRDEGGRLPYLIPELDGAPIHEHDRLPTVDRGDLLPAELTVRSFDALSTPPTDLPVRSTGLVFEPAGGESGADAESGHRVTYDLVPTADVEHVTEFTGPQLRFEFAVPRAVEDAVASHLTAPSAPWNQPRYSNPAADISDPVHRRALADRYDAIGDPAPVNTVIAVVTEAVTSPDAPDGDGLTTRDAPVEAVALLESDPAAVPTFGGVAAVRDVPAGDHRLTVNGAGLAPHSETVAVGGTGDGTTEGGTPATADPDGGTSGGPGTVAVAGVGGEIPLVARESATKLAVDPSGSDADLTDLAVEDDFAGRIYDAPLGGPDAVYVHRGGAYTAEVRDAAGGIGAFRVNPGAESRVTIDRPRTGKTPLAEYLVDVAEETLADVRATLDEKSDGEQSGDGNRTPGGGSDGGGQSRTPGGGGEDGGGPGNAVRGLAQALEAIAAAARRAAERAAAGDRERADANLRAVATRLERATERLAAARGDLPPGLARAADNRLDQIDRRAEQARNADRL